GDDETPVARGSDLAHLETSGWLAASQEDHGNGRADHVGLDFDVDRAAPSYDAWAESEHHRGGTRVCQGYRSFRRCGFRSAGEGSGPRACWLVGLLSGGGESPTA